MPVLEIKVKGDKYIPLDELEALQGELKSLNDERFNKLKSSM